MDDWVERFLKYVYRRNSQSQQTVDSYRRDLEQLQDFLKSQNMTIDDADRLVFLQFMAYLRNEKQVKNSTLSRKLSTYRSFYRYLNEYMGIDQNPLESIQSPKNKRNIPEFLFVDEVQYFLDSYNAADDIQLRDQTLFTLMYACGLRVSEVASLTWDQVNVDSRIVRIVGKGDKERIVPFYKGLDEQLKVYQLRFWEKYAKDNHVFVNQRGKGLTSRGIQYIMQKHANEIQMNMTVHPHMLRHSFATHLLDNGADIRVVQELLGHSSLSTTQIYTHITNSKLQEAYEKAHPFAQK